MNVITLENVKSYATEANLMRGLEKYGLLDVKGDLGASLRYIVSKTPNNRWAAIFLVSEFFRVNKTGGYIGFASDHGFMSI